MRKPDIPANESDRLVVLYRYHILDTFGNFMSAIREWELSLDILTKCFRFFKP